MAMMLEVEKQPEELKFNWGTRRGVGKTQKNVIFYGSFTYDGVEYTLYDCVYMYKEGEQKPYIGKLIKIWEHSGKRKHVKVQWFFRPAEISYYLKDKVLENEILLASGEGVGLANVNPLEAIAGKCNVICISTDSRNPQPSSEQLQSADYVFYRTFDVGSCTVSDMIKDKVGELEAKFIFNRQSDEVNGKNAVNFKVRGLLSEGLLEQPESTPLSSVDVHPTDDMIIDPTKVNEGTKNLKYSDALDKRPSKRTKLELSGVISSNDEMEVGNESLGLGKDDKLRGDSSSLEARPAKKLKVDTTKSSEDMKVENKLPTTIGEIVAEVSKSRIGLDEDLREKLDGKTKKLTSGNLPMPSMRSSTILKKTPTDVIIVTRRPNSDQNKWFKDLPWEDKMHSAQEQGTLVLLQNLDPEYTSGEIEDIIFHALKEKCSAKIFQRSAISSPHCGVAFVIFKSKEAADGVVRRLRDGCLMLPNGRPLVGCTAKLPKLSLKQSSFAGHLTINKLKLKIQKDMKEAVSTSHYSQPNTIEYQMAMEWFLLQEKFTICWKNLYEQQSREIEKLKSLLQRKERPS